MSSTSHKQEGIVILLVLVLLVVASMAVWAFTMEAHYEVFSANHRTHRVRAELLARSGIDIAERTLLDDKFMSENTLILNMASPMDPWRLVSQVPLLAGDGELRITIEDAGSRINLNALVDAEGAAHSESEAFLTAVLEKIIDELPGRDEDKPYEPDEMALAILDWLDRDEEADLGSEADRWRSKYGDEVRPPNRPVFSIDELGTIPDMDRDLIRNLKNYFTTFPMFPEGSGGVNPNTAPPHVLAAIFVGTEDDRLMLGREEDREDLYRVLEARQEGIVFCDEEGGAAEECESFFSVIGRAGQTIFPDLQYENDVFMVRSEARFGEVRACITSIIDREVADLPETLYYRIGC